MVFSWSILLLARNPSKTYKTGFNPARILNQAINGSAACLSTNRIGIIQRIVFSCIADF